MDTIEQRVISVWVVEDNAIYKNSLVALLNAQQDMKCIREYSTCEDVIAAIEKESAPDVILHDIGFAGMSGITSVQKIKIKHPNTQVIMITVYDNGDYVFEAICAGATGYLLKSSSESTIIQSVRDVLNGGSPMNSTIARKAVEVFSKMHRVPKEYGLSIREKEILEQIVLGHGNRHIAEIFHISTHTIDAHLRKIYEKLQVHTRTQATSKALKERLV